MRRILWIFLLFAGPCAFGQGLSLGLEYAQLHAPGMDEMVRTYNFSRPGLTEAQPLLEQGFGVNARYLFVGGHNLQSGIALNYQRFGSRWENQGISNQIGLHLLDLSYVAHLSGLAGLGETWIELEVGVLGTLMRKRLEGTSLEEEEMEIAPGIGGKASLLAGYNIPISDGLVLAPVLKCGFVPYFYAPENEILINQTQGLLEDASVSLLTFSGGIRLQF